MSSLPKPLVPRECDLRDLPSMLVDVDRILRSDTWLLGDGEARAAAMTLWLVAWHQVPAGSLPAQDRALSSLSLAGEHWKRVRDHAMRGWVACSDGRLYHPVVAEKAIEAWLMRLEAKLAGAAGNTKLGRKTNVDPAVIRRQVEAARESLAALNPDSPPLLRKARTPSPAASAPDTRGATPPDTRPETAPVSKNPQFGDGSRTQVEVEVKASTATAFPGQDQAAVPPAAITPSSALSPTIPPVEADAAAPKRRYLRAVGGVQ